MIRDMLVMMPTAEALLIVDGSTRHACQDCGAECWLSPGGQAALAADPSLKPICIRCFAAHTGDPGMMLATLRTPIRIRGLHLVRPEDVTPERSDSVEPPWKWPGGGG